MLPARQLIRLALTAALLTGMAPRCESQDGSAKRRVVLREASSSARKGWDNPLDCNFHSYSKRASRAELVLLLSPARGFARGEKDAEYILRRTLKASERVPKEARLGAGDRLRIAAPVEDQGRRGELLVFCGVHDKRLSVLQSVVVSPATAALLEALAQRPGRARIAELFRVEAAADRQASEFAFAELEEIPLADFRAFRDVLPGDAIRERCFREPAAADSSREDRTALFLRLLPLVAESEDVARIERSLFEAGSDAGEHGLRLVSPYLALATEEQADRLYKELFLKHHRASLNRTAESLSRKQLSTLYAAYTGLRQHRERREVRASFHRAATVLIREAGVLRDLAFGDYRKLGDWRFLADAGRLVLSQDAGIAHERAALMYLMAAHREGVQRSDPELRDKSARYLGEAQAARPEFFAATERIWKLFGSQPAHPPTTRQ